ncbi:hypothetical protein PLESTB_000364400 [Pleodorina starrii]|uniref:Aminotransferase class V domain-containing protein n=1 Tax=Pleodorina starrii TaxID=330485 RepID=A0A9W6BEK4_9CHLO|nr:hypothetical protein PLESTM_000030800 [Pleodorina starrii]GLC50303.1 hypothetical protein PLESTB_000364400 [Pleodorina starrii]GLC64313.1 hypothetical protein PLESTF_000148200 [Pleodorina starrii]
MPGARSVWLACRAGGLPYASASTVSAAWQRAAERLHTAQHGAQDYSSSASGVGVALPHLTRTGCIYLDYNATTPIFPEVAAEMAPFLFEHFGNPSSGHTYGKVCKAALDTARSRLAQLLRAEEPGEIHFTSCGTESDNWALYGAVMAARAAQARQQQQAQGQGQHQGGRQAPPPHVVTSAVEHPALLVHLRHLQEQGLLTYTAVPVDGEGLVDPEQVAAAVQPNTALVTVMHSNNEVGAVQPIAEIAAAARQAHARANAAAAACGGGGGGGQAGAPAPPAGLLVHSDAAQSTGKVELDVGALGVDALTIVGHKFGAPKGVAALYIRRGVHLANYFYGGGQEAGRRAGTENVMQVVGLGAAAELARREDSQLRRHMADMAARLLAAVRAAVRPEDQDKLRLNGPSDPARRLPNTLSLSIRGLNSAVALQRLSAQLAASAGAACHSADGESVSAVLKAMKVPLEFAAGTLRLSTGRHTTGEEVDRAARLIVQEAQRQGVLG